MTPSTLVFLWDNFGPYHMDRMEALYRHLSERVAVIGIELTPTSTTYAWASRPSETFEKRTVFTDTAPRSAIARVWRIIAHLPPPRETCFFLCHYQDPAIFLLAVVLRARGGRVFTMNNSKFDDKPRHVWKEVGKSFFLLPYQGVLSTGIRSKSYWQFLGLKAGTVRGEYNTVSLDRIRRQAGVPPAPNGPAFQDRHFTAIARLVPKKNLSMLLSAYALYRQTVSAPRPLHLCGSGPGEAALRQQADDLSLAEYIVFRGWLQDDAISQTLGQTLTLLLPSVEEQFGNVVIEAQAMGLPVILSDNCGARDLLVRSGVNGFVIEPDNPRGMAYFMRLLSEDEALWRRMCDAATASALQGDVQRFVEGVEAFLVEDPVECLAHNKH
ncbi:glycosyltransferase involved in cell wall biosynthesis [Thiobaca trueperi]|uniref:Glycosyltransferase involved in cell wall biosynthesis n=2 Tax=Thiobaca trueperi TaxID=127458 RepID=A0A4R3MRZ5_9GAMM|nr:glycosyltransferase involved in cell wall biosynthesis [Thiobaca trueperi]